MSMDINELLTDVTSKIALAELKAAQDCAITLDQDVKDLIWRNMLESTAELRHYRKQLVEVMEAITAFAPQHVLTVKK